MTRRGGVALAVVLSAFVAASLTSAASASPRAMIRSSAATVTVKPGKGLVQGTHVHVSGRGFAPGQTVVVAECKAGHPVGPLCDESNARFQVAGTNGGYSLDLVVNSTLIATSPGNINCTTRPGACVISVSDDPGFDNTATVPISFAMNDVISRYSGPQTYTIEHVGAALGIEPAAVPQLGTFALAYVLALTHAGRIDPVPDKGPVSIVTHWLPADYAALQAAAAAHGTTPAEFQKTGALFVAYELGIS